MIRGTNRTPGIARKGGACLLGILFLFSVGCGGGRIAQEKGTITLWETYNNEEHDVFMEIVKSFEEWYAKERGEEVHVRVKRIPFDQHIQKIKFSAITRTAPDIVRVDAGELIDLVYGQIVYDLKEIDPKIEEYLSTFMPVARESVRIPLRHPDGKVRTGVYGIPDQLTGVAIYYNRTMFKEAGIPFPPRTLRELRDADPPWDFKRFREVAKALTKPERNQYGVALNSSLWFSLPFFNAFGADFIKIDPDGKFRCVLDSDSGINALTALASLYWDGSEPGAWLAGAINPDRGFINNKYAMIVSGPWNLKTFRKSGVDFGVTFIPEGPNRREIPVPGGGTIRVGTSTNVGGTDMAILKTTRQPRLCYEFLKYLTRPEVHAKWCNALGQIPVQTLAEPLVDFSGNPDLKVFVEQMRTAVPRPKIPRYGVLEVSIMVPQIERAFRARNRAGVRLALGKAVEEIDRRILRDVNVPR
ncbi:MAG: extracellular solute-binding protein [Candidatus Hydrogenedentota bacterium]|nr:MAG: extracellular solute-binding protein [Candidatus Hydrogenedentota bacterium]